MVLLPFPIQQDFGTWSRYGEQPTPPTPPTKRKRKSRRHNVPALGIVLPDFSAIFDVGDCLTLSGAGFSEFQFATVELYVTGVSIIQPKNDGRWCDERKTTAQYTLTAKKVYGGFTLISREDDLMRALRGYEKQNARAVGSSTSVFTSTCAARQTGNPDAA